MIFLCLFLLNVGAFCQYSCGTNCFYSMRNETLNIQVNGSIEKIGWIEKENVLNLEIDGEIDHINTNFISQFSSLENLQINTKRIPALLFKNSMIETVIIGNDVEVIEESSFENCKYLKNVLFDSNSKVLTIEKYVFKNCIHLKSIVFPKSLQNIKFHEVFVDCLNEIEIHFENGSNYEIQDGIIYSNKKKVLEYFYSKSIKYYVTITSSITGTTFVERKEMNSIIIDDEVERINDGAFQYNDIETIIISKNVKSIGKDTFELNTNLKNVIILSNEITINDGTFFGCSSLDKFIFLGKKLKINNYSFEGCSNLKQIKVTESFSFENDLKGISINRNFITGNCGESTQYIIDLNDEVMMIFGTGSLDSFDSINNDNKQHVKEVIIIGEITTMKENIFDNFKSIKYLTLQSSLISIGRKIFDSKLIESSENNSSLIMEEIEEIPSPFDTLCGNITLRTGKCGISCIFTYSEIDQTLEIEGQTVDYLSLDTELFRHIPSNSIKTIIIHKIDSINNFVFSDLSSVTIKYKGIIKPFCQTNSLRDSSIGYVEVPLEYKSPTFCDKEVKSVGICGETEEDCQWTYFPKKKMLKIEGNGDMFSYSIDNPAPWNKRKNEIHIIIIDGIMTIGDYSFYEIPNIKTIIIPFTVSSIGSNVFIRNKITNLKYKGITELLHCSKDTFINTTIVNVYNQLDPDNDTFCGVESTGLPSNKGICGKTSTECKWKIDNDEKLYIIGNGNMIDWENENEVPWYNQRKKISSIIIGEEIKSIGSFAFAGIKKIIDIVIPESVTTIGSYIIKNTSKYLTLHVKAPYNVKTCSNNTFTKNTDKYIFLPIDYMEDEFCGSEIKQDGICGKNLVDCYWTYISKMNALIISGFGQMEPFSINNQSHWLLKRDKIKFIKTIGIKNIVDYAFENHTALESVVMEIGLETIGKNPFIGCTSLHSVTFPTSVTTFEDDLFEGCESINSFMWFGTGEIPNFDKFHHPMRNIRRNILNTAIDKRITGIGNFAYYGCTMIKNIIIPNSIKTIGNYSFAHMNHLEKISFDSLNEPTFGINVFQKTNLFYVIVPFDYPSDHFNDIVVAKKTEDETNAYINGKFGTDFSFEYDLYGGKMTIKGKGKMMNFNQTNQPWYSFRNDILEIEIEEGITSIGTFAIYKMNKLQLLTIPRELKNIISNAVMNCPNLEYIIVRKENTIMKKNKNGQTIVQNR